MPNPPPPEQCDQCGFDANQWNHQDTIRTIGSIPALIGLWTEGLDAEQAQKRPDADTWSVAEYINHIGDAVEINKAGMELTLANPGFVINDDLAPGPAGEHQQVDIPQALTRIEDLSVEMSKLLSKVKGDDWSNSIVVGEKVLDLDWASRHVVHDTWHHLVDIADVRARLGDVVTPQEGTITQINSSKGGVPKLPMDGPVTVGVRGVEGDSQKARVHHGRPWQALCLWSSDVIGALVAEGHPIQPGSAGENITIGGLDWSLLRAGAVIELGDVRCRLTADALPCSKNNQWFSTNDSTRIHHATHPGWSRWYAEVLTPGTITSDDAVRVAG